MGWEAPLQCPTKLGQWTDCQWFLKGATVGLLMLITNDGFCIITDAVCCSAAAAAAAVAKKKKRLLRSLWLQKRK